MKNKNRFNAWKSKLSQLPRIAELLGLAIVILGAILLHSTTGVAQAKNAGDPWWGSSDGDFRDTPQNHSYVIHPPADQLPQSSPGGSSPDGARLSFVIQNSTTSAGTTIAYMPNQYLVSSTTPNLTFEMRGGHWTGGGGGRDRYDKETANPAWIVDDFIKKRGFLSPVYYEVYQLQTGSAQDGSSNPTGVPPSGKLLGVINPRDWNVFPTTDNGPNNNTNCQYSNGTTGPCWRTFTVGTGGGNITLNGQSQDSCQGRLGSANPCFEVRRDNNKEHVHTADNVWVVRQNNNKQHGHTNGDTPHSHHNPGSVTGDTSQLNRNDNAHDQFNTSPDFYQQPGNCFWEWLNATGTGVQHQHQVFCGQFENNVPVDYGGAHTHPDGSGITDATPGEPYPGEYSLGADKLQYYNRSAGDYKNGGNCFWSWLGDFPDGDKNHTHAVYCADQKANDGGISGGYFAGVDPGKRFNSGTYPNLNGNYVFLIKAVNYQDINHGYVTNYGDIQPKGSIFGGCPFDVEGNIVTCPTGLINAAVNRNLRGNLVQDGYFVRTPKDVAGGKSYVASAPNRLAFNVNYGPVGGTAAEPGEDNEYQQMAGQAYTGLRFQAGGAACRNDAWSRTGPAGATANAQFKVGNADWDAGYPWAGQFAGFEGPGPANDRNIEADVARLGTMNDNNVLNTSGYPQDGTNVKPVNPFTISGTWQTYPGWAMFLQEPNGPGTAYSPNWRDNESFTGRFDVRYWNDGNNLYQGGAPFTWGFWPTCLTSGTGQQVTIAPITPKSSDSGYRYDGRDSFTMSGSDTSATLNFNFQYTLPEQRGQVTYTTVIRNAAHQDIMSSGGADTNVPAGTQVKQMPFQVNSLQANTDYYWLACVNPGPGQTCTGETKFRINKGPAPTVVSGNANTPNTNTNTPTGGGVPYKCTQLSTRLTDPETNQVRPYYAVSWTDSNGRLNRVESFDRQGQLNSDGWSGIVGMTNAYWGSPNFGYTASGSTFTSDTVRARNWTINGARQTIAAADLNKSFTRFLQENVPDGTDITWEGLGEDRYGASDLDALLRPASTPLAQPDAAAFGDQNQVALTNRRFGPRSVTTFHKNTAPNFDSASTKRFKDEAGTTITSVSDGQIVQVETRFVNGGETPMKYYELRDYLGSVRDFEEPSNITVRKNNGTTVTVPASALTRVTPDTQNGNDTAAATTDQRAAWRINLGSNQSGTLADPAFGGVNNQLAPGDTITLTYQVRANRNQNVAGDSSDGEFGRRLTPDFSHFFVRFQENFCDNSNRLGQSINKLQGTVASPWLRGQRGSVGSNRGVFGYDALDGASNATFLVQANGSIAPSFVSQDANGAIGNYTSQQALEACQDNGERPGGVDWRRTMIGNINKLNEGNKNTNLGPLLNPGAGQPRGNLNGPSGNVWVASTPAADAGLTISSPITFSGVGTILVFGDLRINANLTYAPDTGGVNSLGVIVVGNLIIDPGVTNIVGSYYVLDSEPAVDADNCPVDISSTRGKISTGASTNRLNVQGLMVAREFDFARTFLDHTDNETDPAENVYYDGRILANTPPGFGTFRNTASWYEVAP